MQVSAQQDAVSLFERHSKNGGDPNDWAGTKHPALQHHLQMAQGLNKDRK